MMKVTVTVNLSVTDATELADAILSAANLGCNMRDQVSITMVGVDGDISRIEVLSPNPEYCSVIEL